MPTRLKLVCQIKECQQTVPPSLGAEHLCMDHYLEQALCGLDRVAAFCREGHSIDPLELDKLHMQAELAIEFLAAGNEDKSYMQKEQMLQFLLGLANLHEYLSHHVSLVGKLN